MKPYKKNLSLSKNEINQAKLARLVQHRIGHPTNGEFKEIVSTTIFKKCPITINYINNAHWINNTYVLQVKAKTARKKPHCVEDWRVRIPTDWYKMNKFTTVTADVLFICGLPFFITYSRNLGFMTIEFIPNRTAK